MTRKGVLSVIVGKIMQQLLMSRTLMKKIKLQEKKLKKEMTIQKILMQFTF
ncbi:MAG: hypothetical protein KHW86_09580 [Porphyromonadaceae bacterium]|nr:hypothetical protein [Porphyromonadaceae bacterium]